MAEATRHVGLSIFLLSVYCAPSDKVLGASTITLWSVYGPDGCTKHEDGHVCKNVAKHICGQFSWIIYELAHTNKISTWY